MMFGERMKTVRPAAALVLSLLSLSLLLYGENGDNGNNEDNGGNKDPKSQTVPGVNIQEPGGGFTRKRIVKVRGQVRGADSTWGWLIYNGIRQRMAVNNKKFEVPLVLSRGDNLIRVLIPFKTQQLADTVSVYADVPKRDMRIVLTWNTDKSDMDLWVRDPQGEKVYYRHKTSKIGGQLDVDVTTGYGPETFTLPNAMAGNYQIQVQNYSPGKVPLTRLRVDLLLFPGSDREVRRSYHAVTYKKSRVLPVVSFSLDEELRFHENR